MSNATSKPRKWHFYIQDMIGFLKRLCPKQQGVPKKSLSLPHLSMMLLSAISN